MGEGFLCVCVGGGFLWVGVRGGGAFWSLIPHTKISECVYGSPEVYIRDCLMGV